MKWKTAVATAALAAGLPAVAGAQGVGVFSVDVPAQADTRVAVPFANEPFGEFEVQSASGNTATLVGADFTGAFPLNSQGNASYYVRFTTGDLAGRWFNIVGQGTDSVSLNVENTGVPADLSSVDPGDELVVIQHLTVEQVFPDNLEGLSFTPGNAFFPEQSFQVILPRESDGPGTNVPALTTAVFLNGEWKSAGQTADDFVIAPQATLILRNPNPISTGNPDDPQTILDESSGDLLFFAGGQDLTVVSREGIAIESNLSDTVLGLGNTFPTTLGESNLDQVIDPANVFFPEQSDQVLLFDEPTSGAGFNLPSSRTAVFNGTTNQFEINGEDASDEPIQAGDVVIIRKAGGTAGTFEFLPSE